MTGGYVTGAQPLYAMNRNRFLGSVALKLHAYTSPTAFIPQDEHVMGRVVGCNKVDHGQPLGLIANRCVLVIAATKNAGWDIAPKHRDARVL